MYKQSVFSRKYLNSENIRQTEKIWCNNSVPNYKNMQYAKLIQTRGVGNFDSYINKITYM